MSIQIRDEETVAALAGATEPQEVRAPDGRVLGQFIPTSKSKMSFPELGITDDELERLVNDPNAKWVTPEEVMARLREIDRCSP
jgi:hypothetical protein